MEKDLKTKERNPADKKSREETGKKEVGTPSDIGASNEDNEDVELLTTENGVETTKTPAKKPSVKRVLWKSLSLWGMQGGKK